MLDLKQRQSEISDRLSRRYLERQDVNRQAKNPSKTKAREMGSSI